MAGRAVGGWAGEGTGGAAGPGAGPVGASAPFSPAGGRIQPVAGPASAAPTRVSATLGPGPIGTGDPGSLSGPSGGAERGACGRAGGDIAADASDRPACWFSFPPAPCRAPPGRHAASQSGAACAGTGGSCAGRGGTAAATAGPACRTAGAGPRPPARRRSIIAVARSGSHADAVPLSSLPEAKRCGASWAWRSAGEGRCEASIFMHASMSGLSSSGSPSRSGPSRSSMKTVSTGLPPWKGACPVAAKTRVEPSEKISLAPVTLRESRACSGDM